jgi:hypothetical protein
VTGPIFSAKDFAMSKILFGAALIAAAVLSAPSAYAIGSRLTPPTASPASHSGAVEVSATFRYLFH